MFCSPLFVILFGYLISSFIDFCRNMLKQSGSSCAAVKQFLDKFDKVTVLLPWHSVPTMPWELFHTKFFHIYFSSKPIRTCWRMRWRILAVSGTGWWRPLTLSPQSRCSRNRRSFHPMNLPDTVQPTVDLETVFRVRICLGPHSILPPWSWSIYVVTCLQKLTICFCYFFKDICSCLPCAIVVRYLYRTS